MQDSEGSDLDLARGSFTNSTITSVKDVPSSSKSKKRSPATAALTSEDEMNLPIVLSSPLTQPESPVKVKKATKARRVRAISEDGDIEMVLEQVAQANQKLEEADSDFGAPPKVKKKALRRPKKAAKAKPPPPVTISPPIEVEAETAPTPPEVSPELAPASTKKAAKASDARRLIVIDSDEDEDDASISAPAPPDQSKTAVAISPVDPTTKARPGPRLKPAGPSFAVEVPVQAKRTASTPAKPKGQRKAKATPAVVEDETEDGGAFDSGAESAILTQDESGGPKAKVKGKKAAKKSSVAAKKAPVPAVTPSASKGRRLSVAAMLKAAQEEVIESLDTPAAKVSPSAKKFLPVVDDEEDAEDEAEDEGEDKQENVAKKVRSVRT